MTMCKIFKSENSLRELNLKKSILQKLTDKVDKQIDKLTKSIYGDKLYTEHLKGKYCIVCANRDPEMDFRIPDGIVCTHPSNQNGKDMFQCYSHTCEFWKREKPIDEKFTKEYWESLKHFKNEHDIPDIPICITDEKKVFYNNVIVPNLIRCGAIAKKDLEAKCDMIIDDDGNVVECTEEEDDPNQISLFEVVLLPTWFQTAVAA
jgi:hypothetical protein